MQNWECYYLNPIGHKKGEAYQKFYQLYWKHVSQYLAGKRTVPVCRTSSITAESFYFTFNNDLYRMFRTDFDALRKPFEVALKYGFRGYSRGGRNGVFYLRKQDKGLQSAIESLVEKSREEIMWDLQCSPSLLHELKGVKVVCHDPSGKRLIGVMNNRNHRAIFLGFAHY